MVVFRPQPQNRTQIFTGSTRAITATSCTSDSHDFDAGEGLITVTLLETTGNVTLGVQVCAGGIDNNNCTINQTPIAVNGSVSGTRKGGRTQNLKFLPANCSPRSGPVPPGPVQYTARVENPG